MKKVFCFIVVVVVMVSCQSQEKKAEALIKKNIVKTLYKPDTYKPIDTKVDSAFAPYDDPNLIKELLELAKIKEEYDELDRKVKHAKSSMAIWGGSHLSEYDRIKYQEAKEDFDEANTQIEKLDEIGKKQNEKIFSILRGERKFVGYKVLHNYRADNNAGNTLIGDTYFFIDKNFEEVLVTINEEDYNNLQESIKRFWME